MLSLYSTFCCHLGLLNARNELVENLSLVLITDLSKLHHSSVKLNKVNTSFFPSCFKEHKINFTLIRTQNSGQTAELTSKHEFCLLALIK